MLCPHANVLDDEAFFALFNERTAGGGVPINGSIDLTTRCNLRCRHCYIQSPEATDGRDIDEGRAIAILDEASQAGCLFLLMTGGEPLMHPGFKRIYRHARELGLLATVFTNGTLIDEEVVQLFSDFTPLGVEVSIYGATPEMHDNVTGVAGSYEKALHGVRLLKSSGMNVSLKTMVMTVNEGECEAMQELAESLSVSFRMDAALFPRITGDLSPVDLRVDPKRAVECEFSIPGRKNKWVEYLEKMGDLQTDGSLYICGAGRTAFHITEDGMLQPCLMVRDIRENLGDLSFVDAWCALSKRICALRAAPGNPCVQCENRLLCDGCPGFFNFEAGDENGKSDYLCELAECRAKLVKAPAGA
jgi:radical SAM protein with 4Fe4S-binding SPASM domain